MKSGGGAFSWGVACLSALPREFQKLPHGLSAAGEDGGAGNPGWRPEAAASDPAAALPEPEEEDEILT